MTNIRLTKEFSFEMAHALRKYNGPCRNIHGHSYKLLVTVTGKPNDSAEDPQYGMVMDFSELKELIDEHVIRHYDHSLVIQKDPEFEPELKNNELFGKLHMVDFPPTSENLVTNIARGIKRVLPPGVDLFSLKLYETATSCVEWFESE